MTWEHWEVLLLAPIMLLDHALTILGARMKEREYASHFRSEHYELNPAWQTAIRTKRWLNPRHHFLALVLPVAMFWSERAANGEATRYFGPLNAGILSMYAMIIGQHVGNLLVFRRLAFRPGEITGAITISHSFELANSRYRSFACFFPLVAGAALSGHPVAIGAAFGPAFYLLANFVWSARSRSGDPRPPGQTPDGDQKPAAPSGRTAPLN